MYKKIAHRANINGLLENSLAAIQSCAQQSVEGIEIDIRHTADESPIVFHDAHFQRLTVSHQPLSQDAPLVHQLKLEDIQHDFKLVNGEPIPRLEDALDLVKKKNIMVFIELKDKIKPKTLQIIKEHFIYSLEQLRIISFDHEALYSLKRHDDFYSKVKMLALHEIPRTTWIPRALQGIEGVNANIYHPLHAAYLKAKGFEVGIWWLPDKIPPLLAKALFGYIDYFTTDNYEKYWGLLTFYLASHDLGLATK